MHVHVAHPDGEAKFWLAPSIALDSSIGLNDRQLREAQTIDMLQQHLYALASFVSELSESMPESWRVESGSAMNKVKLSGLRERLSHIRPEETVNDDNAGDLQLF